MNFGLKTQNTGASSSFNFNFGNLGASTTTKPTTTPATTTPSFNFGITSTPSSSGTTPSLAAPLSTTLPTTTATTTPAAGPSKPPVTSVGTPYSTTKVSVKTTSGSDGTGNLNNIIGQEKFKNYSPLELRVFDYITQQKIAELPPPPAAPAIMTPNFTSFSTTTTTKTTTQAPASGTNTSGTYAATDATEQLSETAIQNAQGLPTPMAAKIMTAAEFFKPNTTKLKKFQRTEVSIKHEDTQKFVDYSILFKPKSTLRSKTVAAPIVVNSSLLKCGVPVEESTKEFYVLPTNDHFDEAPKIEESKTFKTFPAIKDIHNLNSVKNFRISKTDVATIDFLNDVNISNINFNKDIIIRSCLVDVYRIKKAIPQEGTGMNTKAMIVMNGAWPKNIANGIREKPRLPAQQKDYENVLKEYCGSKNAQFVFYLAEQGIFQFIVPNFNNGPFDLP
ncbi:hypothetical protein TRFO_32221 [Tritrichomonas foetus]|uniref:Peptidase S59 domain-containing protein n=1 Tax=Tritrichomonas foetus TaxID=1144522 RepID=A0A1J4JTU8_9EUKA|nr:hypothetical protein TRFO_32221 [Tritrichomonas foetus]|eukprot:OHT00926.1 hypothetical protein TRFO_32221 [Tritrichomonas foetus]